MVTPSSLSAWSKILDLILNPNKAELFEGSYFWGREGREGQFKMIILKLTKTQGFTLSLEDAFFKKPLVWRGRAIGLLAVLRLKHEKKHGRM